MYAKVIYFSKENLNAAHQSRINAAQKYSEFFLKMYKLRQKDRDIANIANEKSLSVLFLF